MRRIVYGWLIMLFAVTTSFALDPLLPVPTTNLDASTDSPSLARGDLFELTTRFNRWDRVPCSAYASLTAAVTAIGSAERTLVVNSAVSTTGTTVIPATLTLIVESPGLITNNYALIINGPFSTGDHHAFTGSGAVTGLKEARPEWFAINTTPGTTDMGAAINKALAAAPVVKLQIGIYATSVEIPLTDSRKLIGSGVTWWQDLADMPTGTGETIIKYIGAGGANSAVIRASNVAVGTKPTYANSDNNFGVGLSGIIVDGNELAEYGIYTARAGLGSRYENLIVTGTKAHGFWFGEMWTTTIRDIRAIWNYGVGISIGVDTFTWVGGNNINAVEIDNIQAYQNGRDLAAWTTADYMSGYGINFSGGRNNTLHNVVSEENNGVGLVWAPTSGPNLLDGWYSEDNCKIAASTDDRFALWFQSNSGSVLSTIRNFYVLYNGASGLTDAPRVKITGTAVSNAAEIPVFDGAFGGAVFDADFGAYKIDRTAITASLRVVSHLPQYNDSDTITLSGGTWTTTIYAAADGTGTGTKSGIDASNTIPLSQVTRVLKGTSSITTVNIAALTGALSAALTLDGTGINRRITIDGATTGRFTSVAGLGFTLKNWAQELTVTSMALTELLKIYDSKLVFNDCVIMRMNAGATEGAAVSIYNSNVQILGTSAINLTSSSAATKIGINLYGGSTVWFSGAAASVITGESASSNVVFVGVAAVKDSTGWILAKF